ncbi:MAG: hypothetical protein CME16_05705 [Gemmatimonadetes bacterium]|nr:hypothetical protein [Gemmatimonadota bacterium]
MVDQDQSIWECFGLRAIPMQVVAGKMDVLRGGGIGYVPEEMDKLRELLDNLTTKQPSGEPAQM